MKTNFLKSLPEDPTDQLKPEQPQGPQDSSLGKSVVIRKINNADSRRFLCQDHPRSTVRKKQARAENAFHDKLMRVFPFPPSTRAGKCGKMRRYY